MINLIPHVEWMNNVPILGETLAVAGAAFGHTTGSQHSHPDPNSGGEIIHDANGNTISNTIPESAPPGYKTYAQAAEDMRANGMPEYMIQSTLEGMSPTDGYYSTRDVTMAISDYATGPGMEADAIAFSEDIARQQLSMTQAITSRTLSLAEMEQQLAEEQWAHYKEIYKPGEIAFVAEAFEGIPAEPTIEAAGADVRQAFSQEQEMVKRELEGLGLNPGDPKYAQILSDVDVARAAAEAGAKTQARMDVEAQNYAMARDVVGLGKGLPSEAATMAASGANATTQAGDTANAGYSGMYNTTNMMYGMGSEKSAMEHDVGMANLNAGLSSSGMNDIAMLTSATGDLMSGIGSIVPG